MYLRFLLMALCVIFMTTQARASVFISEFMADVSTTQGDANNDGVISSSQDEFIELFNPSATSVDISNWSISDSVGQRHVFQIASVIDAYGRFVVFGGGNPVIDVPFQTATSGSLSLNNSGDTIRLFNATGDLLDEIFYGSEASRDQSLTRSAKNDDFLLHTDVEAGVLYSPGYPKHESETAHAVPEPVSAILFPLGFAATRFMKKCS